MTLSTEKLGVRTVLAVEMAFSTNSSTAQSPAHNPVLEKGYKVGWMYVHRSVAYHRIRMT